MEKIRHRRRQGKGRLDRLPDAIRAELVTRCKGKAPFREIIAWLAAEHHVRISMTTLSGWWIRTAEALRVEAVNARESTRVILNGQGFEVVASAPGASEIRITVAPLSQEAISRARDIAPGVGAIATTRGARSRASKPIKN
jgi:hypothetical protein